jgi:hypothetical protein
VLRRDWIQLLILALAAIILPPASLLLAGSPTMAGIMAIVFILLFVGNAVVTILLARKRRRWRRRRIRFPPDVPNTVICIIYDGRSWDRLSPLLRTTYDLTRGLKWHFDAQWSDVVQIDVMYRQFTAPSAARTVAEKVIRGASKIPWLTAGRRNEIQAAFDLLGCVPIERFSEPEFLFLRDNRQSVGFTAQEWDFILWYRLNEENFGQRIRAFVIVTDGAMGAWELNSPLRDMLPFTVINLDWSTHSVSNDPIDSIRRSRWQIEWAIGAKSKTPPLNDVRAIRKYLLACLRTVPMAGIGTKVALLPRHDGVPLATMNERIVA